MHAGRGMMRAAGGETCAGIVVMRAARGTARAETAVSRLPGAALELPGGLSHPASRASRPGAPDAASNARGASGVADLLCRKPGVLSVLALGPDQRFDRCLNLGVSLAHFLEQIPVAAEGS